MREYHFIFTKRLIESSFDWHVHFGASKFIPNYEHSVLSSRKELFYVNSATTNFKFKQLLTLYDCLLKISADRLLGNTDTRLRSTQFNKHRKPNNFNCSFYIKLNVIFAYFYIRCCSNTLFYHFLFHYQFRSCRDTEVRITPSILKAHVAQ